MNAPSLREILPTEPGCCQSQRLRSALEEFLVHKNLKARRTSLIKLRHFAQYQNLPRRSWPRAVEQLFQLPHDEALRQYNGHRHWARLRLAASCGSIRQRGTALHGLSQFLREKGLIDWTFPRSAGMTKGEVWRKCAPSFHAKVEEWFDGLRVLNYASCTLMNYGGCLRMLGEYLKYRGVEYWAVDNGIASDWVKSLVHQGNRSDRTIHSIIVSAAAFYRWLWRRRVIAGNPFEDLLPFRFTKKLPVFLDETEILTLIQSAKGPIERALIEFLYATGCRVSEASMVNLSDLNLEARTIRCLGKGRKERILLFNEATAQALREYLPLRAELLRRTRHEEETALFVGYYGTRGGLPFMQGIVREMSHLAGIKKRVTPHVIRHSYATHLLNHGADLYSLMSLLGHKNVETTIIYLHIATDRLAEVYRRCHPRK